MKTKRAVTLIELMITISIIAILTTVAVIGTGSFIENRKTYNDELLVEQMNDLLQYTAKGEEIKNITQVYRIVKNVYSDPENEDSIFVWNQKTNEIIIVDKDEDLSDLGDGYYYIDGSSAMIIGESKEFDFNKQFGYLTEESQ